MILDFNEIPLAKGGSGLQDTFELFARDFFQILGYEIIQHPDRGADGKKDLIIKESRSGLSGTTHISWMVSCKHYSHSGKSVSDTDEPNITDRVSVHNCEGFIGFYSTLPATSLSKNLEGLKKKIGIQSFDKEQIEKILLESPQGLQLASRYFPKSYGLYTIENPKPANIFADDLAIHCEYCNKNLLEDKTGIFVLLRKYSDTSSKEYKTQPYSKAYFSCKGRCDHILRNKYSHDEMLLESWVDISNYLYPTGYIKKTIEWLNRIQDGESVEGQAFDKLKQIFLNAFPYVSREQTSQEKDKIKDYLQGGYPEYL